ncbi:MAG: metal-dependent transcriptional regulator [Candidatus Bathyarchaeia archaeon]
MNLKEEISAVIEEYLECIFKLQEKSGIARTSDIVKILGVVPGTVTNTLKWLKKKGLIIHEPYKGIKLTKKGRKIAIQVIRKHRLSERLLTDILHMEWNKVHEIACKLEHSITEEMIKPLEKALRHPKTCPHGNPIPTKCGGIIKEKLVPLINLTVGMQGIVAKIIEEQEELLQYLGKLGLFPGAPIEIMEKAPLNDSITMKIGSTQHVLGRHIASLVYIKQLK